MGLNAVVFVQGSDLTDADTIHLTDWCEKWATEPVHVDASQYDAGAETGLRITLRTGSRFAATDGSSGCWPQVADSIATVQAAFPGRDVYYTHDAFNSDLPSLPAQLVDDALLAEHQADWVSRWNTSSPYDDQCRHEQLKFDVEKIEPLFRFPHLVRPEWWYASVGVACVACGAWEWNNAAADEDLVPPDGALTGPRARIALTALLEWQCRTLRDAFAVAWSATA